MDQIPAPARERLLYLMRTLEHTQEKILSSAQIEALTGWSSHTIRKDISYLNENEGVPVGSSSGYEKETLLPVIKKALGLNRKRKFCIVGLGRLGSAYLNLGNNRSGAMNDASGGATGGNSSTAGGNPGIAMPDLDGFELAAGFDTNVNRIEILPSPVPLYPAFKMGEVIGRFEIEIALLCVPAAAAQTAAEKLAAAGIKGIVNFAPAGLKLPPEIAVRNVYITDDLRALAVKMSN